MYALLFLGVIVALLWIRDVSQRTKKLEREIAAMRTALAGGAVAPPPADEAAAPAAAPGETPDDDAVAAKMAAARKKARGKKGKAEETVPPAEPVEGMTADNGEAEKIAASAIPPIQTSEPRRKRSAADIESLVGARWSVILGGIAIALGALFLVRYTIEAGLLGPGARVALGALLAAALLGGGEWLRRHDRKLNLPAFEKADIPGILTGAGAVAAFGTLYAAHALYGFVGPGTAFVGLTLIGLASLLLSAIHGPKLAAIGLLGAYGAPLLVESVEPNPLALALHTLAVTGSVMAVARLRDWLWLALAGVAGGILWAFLAATFGYQNAAIPNAILLVGLAIIFAAGFAWELADRPNPPQDRPIDWPAFGAFWLLAVAFAFHCAAGGTWFPQIGVGLVLGLIFVATASIWPAISAIATAAAFVVVFAALSADLNLIDLPGMFGQQAFRQGLVPPDIYSYVSRLALLAAPVAGLAIAGAWRAAATAPKMAGKLAIGASLIGVFVPVAAYLRVSPFETHMGFGVTALALAALFVALTEFFTRKRPEDWTAHAPAAFAVAAVSLIAFALGVMLSGTWMPLGFALTAAGIAYVYATRPLGALPVLAAIASLLAAMALWASVPFHGETIGLTPFFNKLIILLGLPSATILLAGEVFRRKGTEKWGAAVTAIGLALLAWFIALELRHWITGGNIASGTFNLADMGVQTIAMLGFAIGLQRLARFTQASVYEWASLVAGAISAIMIALGLFLLHNPLFSGDDVGEGKIFNLLLPGYLVTGMLAGIVALMARGVRPRWYTLSYAFLAGVLLFLYFTLMTRQAFQTSGSLALFNDTSDTEFWTYSAVWLILGGALLTAGLFLKSLPLRIASAVMIGLTICKVFLLDMAALTGALRAFSFIGLGLSLLVIGRFYQRILVRTGNTPSPEPDEENGAGLTTPDK